MNDFHLNYLLKSTCIFVGGLKVWESTYDLVNYLLEKNYQLENKKVLDLGCGAGVIGILCLLKGSSVHFQDYVSITSTSLDFESLIPSRNF